MFLSQIHVVTGVKSLIPTLHIQTCGSSRVIYLSGIRCVKAFKVTHLTCGGVLVSSRQEKRKGGKR